MNLIEKQAERFCKFKLRSSIQYQEFIDIVKSEISIYSQYSHKLQFIETVMFLAKEGYEEHLASNFFNFINIDYKIFEINFSFRKLY